MSGAAFIRRYEPGDEVGFRPRADMKAEFALEGERLPPGRKWVLIDEGHVLAFGGQEGLGGWLLPGENMGCRHWALIAARLRDLLRHGRMVARVSSAPGAVAFLTRLGFVETDVEGVYDAGC